MLVFWKEKLVLLAVPKTGTTALEQVLAPRASIAVLDPPELKHAPVYRYNRFFRPMFEKACKTDDIETVAVMREPVSWLGSWYRYRSRAFLKGRPTSTDGLSFDEFVLAYADGQNKPFANVGSQARFLEARQNGIGVSHLFRYEDQPRFLAFLQDRLNVTLDLPRANVSPKLELSLSASINRKLRDACPEDFELYDSIP